MGETIIINDRDDDDSEQVPRCSHCGGDMEWVECEECDDGETPLGLLHDLDPLWYDEDDTEPCETCEGEGGWWRCANSPDWCEAHPIDEAQGRGFYATSPAGNVMHVNGARDMPEETLALIGQVADLALAQVLRKREVPS